MEIAYLEQNRREYEITKHVSLNQVDPLALMQLRQTGACSVRLPEALFDLDFPGHYMRRIKSVSVSIPCVTGPYTGVQLR
jgi:Tc toxin complex TcA C-terminal TcB-binding domain